MLQRCEEHMSTSGSNTAKLRPSRPLLHATRHQLHCILCPDMYHAAFGKLYLSYVVKAALTSSKAAITSPDPEINGDARDFFVRHMRILEQCIVSWPMPEMHAQVNALREAFSTDISKPFELKPSFPFPSPAITSHRGPSSNNGAYRHRTSGQDPSIEQPDQVDYNTRPVTSMSAGDSELKIGSPIVHSSVTLATGQRQPQASTFVQPQKQAHQWDPTRIFE